MVLWYASVNQLSALLVASHLQNHHLPFMWQKSIFPMQNRKMLNAGKPGHKRVSMPIAFQMYFVIMFVTLIFYEQLYFRCLIFKPRNFDSSFTITNILRWETMSKKMKMINAIIPWWQINWLVLHTWKFEVFQIMQTLLRVYVHIVIIINFYQDLLPWKFNLWS